jgi:hypothetical protein
VQAVRSVTKGVTMNAIVQTGYGSADVMEYQQVVKSRCVV